MRRPLRASERALLKRFETVDIPEAAVLSAQLNSIVVSDESPGYLSFVSDDADVPRVRLETGLPLDGWYSDDDGGLVMLILHVAFPEGQISSLERFRPDGEPIVNFSPDPAEVRVAGHPVTGPGQGATFDIDTGWHRIV